MSWLRLLFLVAVLVPAVVSVPHAFAQPAGDSSRALALGHEAIGLYNKGSWADARAKFEEAERLAHSPVFVLYLARCARNAGDLAAAKEAYERLVKEAVPRDAPAPWAAAVESAKQELPELEKRIAEANAAAAASASATASASASGAPAATAGPTASGSAPSPTSALSVPVPAATAVPTGSAPAPSASASSGPIGPAGGLSERGPLSPGVAALGVGGVGIGVGIGLFAHALSIASGIKERCPDRCPEELPNRNTAVTFADGATGAFVAGGAALAAGLVLVIVRPGGKPGSGAKAVSVQPGFASLRVSGSF